MGGAEQVTVTIVNGLAARGYNVELLLAQSEGEMRSRLADQVCVVELPPVRAGGLGVVAHLPAIATYLRDKKPAALFPQLTHVSVACLALELVYSSGAEIIPIHHTPFRDANEGSLKDRVVGKLAPILYPMSDHIIAVSEGVARSIDDRTSVSRADISVLYNPIDFHAIQEQARSPVNHDWIEDQNTRVILYVGRLAEEKDLQTWLRTFQQVHERNPDTRAVLAGDGPLRQELAEFADRLGISDVTSFTGYVDNPYPYMKKADLFFLSSRYEGLPTVLMEALACGCPIVSTDCSSGPREILKDGQYGRLAPVGDVPGLTDAVLSGLNSPVSVDLTERAWDFALESVLDEYERFLSDYVIPK